MSIELHCCDCLDLMACMSEGHIDLTVTSPPYDGLRMYNGYSFDFENIAKELFRVTKEGGVVVWVVGDQTKNGSESGTSFRQVLFFKDCGFSLHDTMIYQKGNYLPLTHKRYEQEFEYMFVLVKGNLKTFNPITVPCKYAGAGTSPTLRRTGKKLTSKGRRIIKARKRKGNVWSYDVGKDKSTKDEIAFSHPAIFPEKLAEDHILSWSNEGDLVFDPFSGSGTVAKMARKDNRDFIGCDISQDYVKLTRKRLEGKTK